MTNRRIKYLLIGLGILLILLIVTNPNYKDFEKFSSDYKLDNHFDNIITIHYPIRKKVKNYFIFSVYEISLLEYNGRARDFEFTPINNRRYIGFLGNFF